MKSTVIIDVEAIPSSPTGTEELWIQHGRYVLNRKHLNQVVQGKELCDLHVNAFKSLLYPHVGGLQCTLYQDSKPLQVSSAGITIQILLIQKNHWATLCINEDGKICLYDSFNTSVFEDTSKTMSKLLYCQEKSFTVQIINLNKKLETVIVR